jgi:hypothetical protein
LRPKHDRTIAPLPDGDDYSLIIGVEEPGDDAVADAERTVTATAPGEPERPRGPHLDLEDGGPRGGDHRSAVEQVDVD